LRLKRSGFTIPRPNYVWLVDRYLKLTDYSFEIYSRINIYLRYFLWCYVSVSVLTDRSIFT
ncbi:hypothetical protein BT67DRAFT_389013, partial [Trichocladium antarcticum]